ncbi:TetR/AcrR family transcriptional regulator [Streptomyces sp. NPDC023723]|uniref:TetR/AcrR family transcriptional regulator n=1 Tax=Streptomyces sp. NPDC023723 TaxID=3154323 RepID=UPI0033F0D015
MTSTKAAATPASTRERVVEAAIDLFARQGYGGTSLRHIAEALGITKAAVYHHFHTKDDIARVVVGRALEAQEGMVDRLLVAGTDPAAWQRALPRVIDIALGQRQLLYALERDEDTYRALFADDPAIGPSLQNEGAPLAGLLADPGVDPAVRVRLGCVLGAVLGPLTFLSDHYQDVPGDQLRHHLNQAIAVLLQDLPAQTGPRAQPGV